MPRTPRLGLTIPDPDGNDDIGEWPGLTAQGFTDLENATQLEVDSHSRTDLSTTYPIGISVMGLTTTGSQSLGWGSGAATDTGMVVTIRRYTDSFAHQLWFHGIREDHPIIQARVGTASGWSVWTTVIGPGQVWAQCSGTQTWSNTSQAKTTTIAFPAGIFSAAPNVVASPHDRRQTVAVMGISSTGFTLALGANGSGGDLPVVQDWYADWIATQTY